MGGAHRQTDQGKQTERSDESVNKTEDAYEDQKRTNLGRGEGKITRTLSLCICGGSAVIRGRETGAHMVRLVAERNGVMRTANPPPSKNNSINPHT